MLRQYSLFTRRRRAVKERDRILASFYEWKGMQAHLPPPAPLPKRLLIIRLDDIGDYVLFRNQLGAYKQSSRWSNYRVTLLGNASWEKIFTACDQGSVDDAIWVNKGTYLRDPQYRREIWEFLRAQGFETVIAPSRTRPLLLDDLCMLAASPLENFGSVNTYVHPIWNRVSDSLYQHLYRPPDITRHEFFFNGDFVEWACDTRYQGNRPAIHGVFPVREQGSYILCFIGANTRSKRWPVRRWVQLINLYRRQHSDQVIVAGASAAEIKDAQVIQRHTGATSIAGQRSLLEFLHWVAGAKAVISNDTMAAHLGVSFVRPTIIVANGVNYQRFTDYAAAGISGVATVYPDIFNRRRRLGNFTCNYEDVVTADIESIRAHTVFNQVEALLQIPNNLH